MSLYDGVLEKFDVEIASGELSVIKGIDQMGRVTTSMVGGLWGMAKGAAIGAKLMGWIPVIGIHFYILNTLKN